MPGRVNWLFATALLLMSFHSGDPRSGKQSEFEKLYQLANHYFNNPNPSETTDRQALTLFDQIIRENVDHPGNCPDTIIYQCYLKSGILLDVRADYAGARNRYLQAIQVRQHSKEIPDSATFQACVYAGTAYYNLNNFDSSSRLLLKAESIMNLYPGVQEKERLYSMLGVLYYDNGNYLQSKNYFSRALDITRSKTPFDGAAAVSFQTNMAAAYYRLGQYSECLSIYRSIVRDHLASGYQGIPNYVYNNMGRANTALHHLDEAMACFRKVNSQELPGVFNEMARTEILRKRFRVARDLLDRLTQLAALPGNRVNDLDIGINALYRAELFNQGKDYLSALHQLQQAIIIFSGSFTNPDPFSNPTEFTGSFASYRLFDALFRKANTLQLIYSQAGEKKYLLASMDAYQSAVDLMDYIEKNFDTDEAKIFLKQKNQEVFQKAISVCLGLSRIFPSANYLRQAFSLMEKNKASVLAGSLQLQYSARVTGIDRSLLEKQRNIRFNIARLNVQTDQEQDSRKLAAINKEKTAYEIELSRLQKNLEQNSQYYNLAYNAGLPGIETLQLHLDNNQALISFYFSQESLHIFSITRSSFLYSRIDSVESLEADLRTWIDLLTSRQDGRKFHGDPVGMRIYERLIRPLQNELRGKSEWKIVPDGILYLLPFESLPSGETSKALVETTTISYEFSPRFLVSRENATTAFNTSGMVLGFAPFTWKAGRADRDSTLAFDPLPRSGSEISGLDGKIFLDSSATKKHFLQEINKYPIIHLATHAVADMNNPSSSFIAFYPDYSVSIDHSLYLEELYGLNLDSTRLVIISACESGKGELLNSEGVMSFARAFAYAGCTSTVNSLWRADDAATSSILIQFHKYLEEGYSKSRALQLAKVDYIHSNALHTSPDYWSNLIVIGNTDPLYDRTRSLRRIFAWIFALGSVTVVVTAGWRRRKKKSTVSKDSGF